MKGKTVLVVDGGGRASVLVHKYSQSPKVGRILAIPGNDLMQLNSKVPVKTYLYLKTTSVDEIVEIAKLEKVDLADINQDNAVEVGLVDELIAEGITTVGPTSLAGQIEWDKAWARNFMKKYKIPHPKYKICKSEKEGMEFIKKQKDAAWFIKASGLALGKGALSAKNNREAIHKIGELKGFGKAAETYLIEEALVGEEFSSYALCDKKTFKLVGHAQDNKRVNNFDEGPNTGGMGCSCPPLMLNQKHLKQILEIFKKTVNGLNREGRPYQGVLYLGGMVVKDKVYVIEFNARWGEPEANVILPAIKNDLYALDRDILQGRLNKTKIRIDGKYRIVITGCSRGYPNDYSMVKGKRIFGIEEAQNLGVTIYGAGIVTKNGKYFVSGGRLFYLLAEGRNIVEAREKAYGAMALISIEGNNLHYRTDIGWRDVERMRKVGNGNKN